MARGLDKRRLAIALLASAAACTASTDYGDTEFRCARDQRCPDGFDCIQRNCVPSGTVDPAVPGRFRRALTIDNAGRTALEGFPLLVALDSGRIDYAAAGDGSSLRFTGDDQLTLLPHQIDTWNPEGRSLVWVRVPELAAGTSTTIYMYWGGEEPPAALAPEDTFDDRFVGVWHLDDDPAAGSVTDDAAGRFAGTPDPSMTADNRIAGVLGQALHFGAMQDVSFGDQPELELPVYTWSMWLRGDAAPAAGSGTPLSNAAVQLAFNWNGATLADAQSASHSDAGGPAPAKIATPLEAGVWYHVGATYDGTNLRVFLDGAVAGSIPAGAPVTAAGPLCVGNNPDATGFSGDVDELRILDEALDPDWLEAEHASASDSMVRYSDQEQLF